jgi:hypothetical protein
MAFAKLASAAKSPMSGVKINFLGGKKQLLATLGDSACA